MDDILYVQKSSELMDKQVLGLITYLDHEENVVKIVEVYGLVKEANENTVIVEGEVWQQEEGDDEMDVSYASDFSLPFDTENYWQAEGGEYKLILSGQHVPNPDFLTQWRVHPPKN